MSHSIQTEHRHQIPYTLGGKIGRFLFILCNIPLLSCYSALASAHEILDDAAYNFHGQPLQFELSYPDSRRAKRYFVSDSRDLERTLQEPRFPLVAHKEAHSTATPGRESSWMENLLLLTTAILISILLLFLILRHRETQRRRKFDDTINEVNSLFTTTFDKSPLMLAITQVPECVITLANDAMLHTLGYERHEIIGKTSTEIGILDEKSKSISLQQIQQSGKSSLEIEFQTRCGEPRHGRLSANLITYQNYEAALLIIEDTTDFQNAVEALQSSELRFRTIFEHSFSGIVLADQKGKLITVNSAFANIIGYNRDELAGISFRDFSYPEDLPEEEKLLQQIRSGESDSFQHKKRLVRKDGSLAWIEIALNVIRNEQGAPYLYVSVINDISKQLNTDREKQKLEKQLQQSQKIESIGQLTGGIAHDFNNILASILGFAELSRTVYGDSIPEKLNSYLTEIITVGQRARNLVEQLLIFSRGIARDAEIFDPKPAIEESIRFISSTLPSTVELITLLDDAPGQIYASTAQLNQVLLNLVLNARQAINDSGRIQITTKQLNVSHASCASCHKDIDGSFLAIEVCDSGQGIDAVMLPRIFEPFFTTREMGQGSGMGLAMVHGIMHGAKGHIRIFPSQYGGACFQLLFPLQGKSAAKSLKPLATGEAPIASPARNKHILVVDDEAPITVLMQEILELHDYRVSIFNEPQQALQAFHSNPTDFDLLLTDQTMPAMNGTELATKIREQRPEMPVILCTGYSNLVHPDNLEGFEIDRLLYKPLNNKQLLDSISELLASKAV